MQEFLQKQQELLSTGLTEKLGEARMSNQGLGPATVEKHDDDDKESWRSDLDKRTSELFRHAHCTQLRARGTLGPMAGLFGWEGN